MNLREKLDKYQENQNSISGFSKDQYVKKWVHSVEHLYSVITEQWLQDLIEKKQLNPDFKKIALYENALGEYKIDRLELKFITNNYIVFEPIAGLTLGGFGRIDMYKLGDIKNKKFLVRIEDNDDINSWKLVTPEKRTKYLDFNRESFEKVLELWL